MKLKDAEQQLKGLTDSTKIPEEDEDEVPGPHGPLIELTVEPGDELLDLDTEAELNSLMDSDQKDEEQDINVVEVGNKDTAEVTDKAADKAENRDKNEPGEETKPDETPQDDNDGFSNLFSG